MGHGNTYHGKKYNPTPKGTGKYTPAAAPTAQNAVKQQFSIIDFLRKHIGGRWRANPENHQFEAEFVTPIAQAISDFMAPLDICAKLTPARTEGESTLAITTADYLTLKNSGKFNNVSQSLEKKYRDLSAMGRRIG